MLKESYLSNMKNLPKNSIKIVVTRTARSLLSPSWTLLNDYKNGKIDWEGYTKRFKEEMDTNIHRNMMREIKKLAMIKDVYLICFEAPGKNCHRYILMEMINNIDD